MTREQALFRIVDVVNGARHPWYQRTTELAGLYRKLYTGDGLDSLLRRFVTRESSEAFEQRVALTQHTVTTTARNVMDVFNKVPRANYQRVVAHRDQSEDNTGELENRLRTFWGDRSLDVYVKTRWLEANATDPNGFVVVEFEAFDYRTERAKPYPFEVSSYEAVDYAYKNQVLQHLIVKTEIPLPTKSKPDGRGDKYTVYLENETFVLVEIDPASRPLGSQETTGFQEIAGALYLHSKKRWYVAAFAIPHNAGRVPAKQIGYCRDPWTAGHTFEAPYEKAVPILKKSIKVNSELDITMAQQVFPHRLQYMPKCPAQDCHDGYTGNGAACETCNGTGHASITSAMDAIYIKMPKRADEILDLEKLLAFKGPPMDVVKFQSEYVDKLTAACKAVVFNSESFTQTQIHNTATGQMLDRDNVQDALYTCAVGFSEMWQFLVEMTAAFADLNKGLEARLIFSKDFKLKGLTELVADLEAAKKSEAGPAVIQNIQEQIARLMYADSPEMFRRWQAQERLNPFSGMSETQISLALSDPAVPSRYKTRYLMLGVIFAEIEAAMPIFYLMPHTDQAKVVEEKVKSYMAESAAGRPIVTLPPVGTN